MNCPNWDFGELTRLIENRRKFYLDQIHEDTDEDLTKKLILAASSIELCNLMFKEFFETSLLHKTQIERETQKRVGDTENNIKILQEGIKSLEESKQGNLSPEILELIANQIRLKTKLITDANTTLNLIKKVNEFVCSSFEFSILTLQASLKDLCRKNNYTAYLSIVKILLKSFFRSADESKTMEFLFASQEIAEAFEQENNRFERVNEVFRELQGFSLACRQWSVFVQNSKNYLEGKSRNPLLSFEDLPADVYETVGQQIDEHLKKIIDDLV